jgi:hypothetical protein
LNTFLNSLFTFRFPDFTEREYWHAWSNTSIDRS